MFYSVQRLVRVEQPQRALLALAWQGTCSTYPSTVDWQSLRTSDSMRLHLGPHFKCLESLDKDLHLRDVGTVILIEGVYLVKHVIVSNKIYQKKKQSQNVHHSLRKGV